MLNRFQHKVPVTVGRLNVRLRQRLATSILGLFVGTVFLGVSPDASAREPVWRASRPLRVSVEPSAANSRPLAGWAERRDAGSAWQFRADRLRQLRATRELVRADIEFLEARLRSYSVFRFSDGMAVPIVQTANALLAARLTVLELEAEMRRVSRGQ